MTMNQPQIDPNDERIQDGSPEDEHRGEGSVGRAVAVGTGMFLPAAVLLAIAVVVILVLAIW